MQKYKKLGWFMRMLIVMFVGAFIGGMCGLWFGLNGLWLSIPLCILWGIKSDEIIDFLTQPQNE